MSACAAARRLALAAALAAPWACSRGMDDQPRVKPLAGSDLFPDGRSARPRVEGTVAQGELERDATRATGKEAGADARRIPLPVTRALLERGRDRYDVFCAPCHGRTGDGDGTIVQRGFPAPPTFHDDRARASPVGRMFDVASNGYGAMAGYRASIARDDRWAVVAYVRALQWSRHASLDDVPPADRARLQESPR